MSTRHLGVVVVVAALALGLGRVPASAADGSASSPVVLSSWNDVASRAEIVAFVERVTKEGGPDWVPPSERIAVFDNDGTLWSEQPFYFQLQFAIDRAGGADPEVLLAGGKKALLELVMETHGGMTTDEFAAAVRAWVDGAKHPKTGRPYTEMVYQPMLELLAYLRANGFRTWITSGGGIEFMRVFAEEVYGIPPEQVIGSSIVTEFALVDGVPTIRRLPQMDFIDDGAGKPVAIHRFIGRRPILAFGNSDGDHAMLQWTCAGDGPRLCGLVHHTDAEREWAYDRDSHIGRLDQALTQAREDGWTLVDMKHDWTRIYP